MEKGSKSILIVAATEMEISPLLSHLQQTYNPISGDKLLFEGNGLKIHVAICGIGMLATGFNLAKVLNNNKSFDCAIQLGIAGAYPTDQCSLGDVVNITADRVSDLGATTKEGIFLSIQEIGLTEPSAQPLPENPPAYLIPFLQQFPVAEGLTVNHISGDPEWRKHFPIAADTILTESMEGAAFHYSCTSFQLPFIQIRSISNWVEPRDKSRWQMGLALQNLNKTAIDLLLYL